MKMMLFRHLWGVSGEWETVFPQIQADGYHGIEVGLPEPAARRRFRQLLDAHGFDYIAQIYTQGGTVEEHLESFRTQLAEARSLRPRLVNSQSGRDAFSEDDAVRFFEGALQIEERLGIPVAHETHRGRVLFHPGIAGRLVERFENLKLCCDFSHWVCVCERLIDDQIAIVERCAGRCVHLHARVGYEQGPQVPDPRAPEYARHLAAHEAWWDRIWAAQARRGDAETSLTPEFGPPDYQHTLPFTNVPVSDLREICNWQAQRQAARFAASGAPRPRKSALKK